MGALRRLRRRDLPRRPPRRHDPALLARRRLRLRDRQRPRPRHPFARRRRPCAASLRRLWRLSVTRPGAPTVVHEVRILGGGFPDEDPALLLGRSRSWPCQQLPAAAVLSTDAALSLSRSGANLNLRTDTLRVPHRIVARVADGGPILDVARPRVFWLRAVPDGFLHRVEKLDGCEVWIDDLETFGVPDDVSVRASVVLAGPTFDDFTLSQTRSGADFFPASRWPLRFLHPDGSSAPVCHSIQAFQAGRPIGDAHSNPLTMPQEMK